MADLRKGKVGIAQGKVFFLAEEVRIGRDPHATQIERKFHPSSAWLLPACKKSFDTNRHSTQNVMKK